MGLKLLHLHLHGLIRSHDLELGRDSDTGGQTLYVLELVKELAASLEVDQVDLVTRLIQDRRLASDYSRPRERIAPSANIIRIPFGPKRYLRKELLWPYLDQLVDQLIDQLKQAKTLPDWIHAHYADAGYVGALVSSRLGIPFVFTGHSLGREKKRRLLESGMDHLQIENTYSISRRIGAEELALANANLVVTSTFQEANEQYSRYKNFVSKQAKTIPPGVDLRRFNTISKPNEFEEVQDLFAPFLRKPNLPPLLAISRAVRRKNIPALIEAFGRSPLLRQKHNLVLILGTRTDMKLLDKQQKDVFQQIFELVDKYQLYGQVAYPKFHRRDQIAPIYRWASKLEGLFVNPALTEPFGLTLLEAAACGLPMAATDDGGPKDILSSCRNGLLFDATDLDVLQNTLELAGSNKKLWQQWSSRGIDGIKKYYSWNSHVSKYLSLMKNQFNLSSTQSLAQVIPLSGIRAS
ncbi:MULTISPECIES: glycosyltransferase [Prochlorococcus]|uniref:sucrose-phosphate synthase n=1 Tax=Prochlorococcus marinus (strain SARG / CCMP1375 / SS120) TaxID=167539 RepID=Q7V9F3_PROMA|nr:Glycosyltransferase [Prochlorococcus marinus subsp. marinus str. CCMP1375]KGG10463.1 Sucrose phosphate synthase [Prochlorococcus marinus str. LG]KGG20230.1 Sucrose phosphate synthase [Prochlorococcus marinus str. SS2]KGG23827.1 Sucrose phosphate synthase [Prochlorococcus marinus str. SS35]KGG33090.1 Sucrose phosphate synthase [Prochlorococcus marinus str. SS51]KGG37201.1 Sucrose phosphate synthase [Prochlorococcus sp. SS52]